MCVCIKIQIMGNNKVFMSLKYKSSTFKYFSVEKKF